MINNNRQKKWPAEKKWNVCRNLCSEIPFFVFFFYSFCTAHQDSIHIDQRGSVPLLKRVCAQLNLFGFQWSPARERLWQDFASGAFAPFRVRSVQPIKWLPSSESCPDYPFLECNFPFRNKRAPEPAIVFRHSIHPSIMFRARQFADGISQNFVIFQTIFFCSFHHHDKYFDWYSFARSCVIELKIRGYSTLSHIAMAAT